MADDPQLENFIRSSLGVSSNAQCIPSPVFGDLRLDLQVNDPTRGRRFFVQVRSKATLEDLSFLNLVRDVHGIGHPEEGRAFLLAVRSINPKLEVLAASLGIGVIKLPADIAGIAPAQTAAAPVVRTTSEKAWKVIYALLSKGRSSIRSLSISEKVSYGWAHGVVSTLLEQEIARKDDGYVVIEDVERLLNGVYWERPLLSSIKRELFVRDLPAVRLAPELTDLLYRADVNFAFTGYLAGSILTGEEMQRKEVQLYLPKEKWPLVEEFLGGGEGVNGIRLQLIEPDRDVRSSSLLRHGVRITSSGQTLLDLAGMGPAARGLALSVATKATTESADL
ncbi:MAG: hypothetical protein WCK39_00355 [Methanomassiliicoccales archaeon]